MGQNTEGWAWGEGTVGCWREGHVLQFADFGSWIIIMNSIREEYFNPEMGKERSKAIQGMLQQPEYRFVRESVAFLRRYMNGQDFQSLFVSFNGGKDATVILYLTLIAKMGTDVEELPLKCIYFTEPSPFEEVDAFIAAIRSKIPIEWNELPSKRYAQQLRVFGEKRRLQYVVMGSRKDDPYCENLGMAAASDVHKGYPEFFRLNPIIGWNYEQVWTFIRDFQLPYCPLYDEGYTYLGNKNNTTKNSTLYDGGKQCYRKASEAKSAAEKASRLSQPHSTER